MSSISAYFLHPGGGCKTHKLEISLAGFLPTVATLALAAGLPIASTIAGLVHQKNLKKMAPNKNRARQGKLGNSGGKRSVKTPAPPAARRKGYMGTDKNGEIQARNSQANQLVRAMKFATMAPRERGPRKVNLSAFKLSIPAAKFAAAVLNPWASEARDSYIPIGNGRSSQKVLTFSRFTMTIGTAGVGWVVISPCLSSDGIACFHTGAAYAGTTAVPYANILANTLNVGVFPIAPNAPYSTAQLAAAYTAGGVATASVYGRVVSCGITATYTGTTLNEGGLLYCFTDPDHNSVIGSSVANLGSRSETDITNVTRNKCYLADYPLNESETFFERTAEYSGAYGASGVAAVQPGVYPRVVPVFPFASACTPGPDSLGLSVPLFVNGQIGQPTSIIMATGIPGNTIHVEVIQHLEYQGILAEGKLTPSPVDRPGFERVQSAVALAAAKRCSRSGMDFAEAFNQSMIELNHATKPAPPGYLARAIG